MSSLSSIIRRDIDEVLAPPVHPQAPEVRVVRHLNLQIVTGRRVTLFMANTEGSLAMLDVERGTFFGSAKSPWVAPKNACAPLHLALLDAEGAPAAPLAGACTLGWPNNSEGVPPSATEQSSASGEPVSRACLHLHCKVRNQQPCPAI